jgi:ectoine hydroxylase-related dioxygenase (phytanoyl-CoA dioxygenase family)
MNARAVQHTKSGLYSTFLFITAMFCNTALFAQQSESDRAAMLQTSRNAVGTKVAWEEAVTYTFDDPAQLSSFPVAAGKFEISGGSLRAIEGSTNRAIMLTKNNFGNYVRIEMEVTNFADKKSGRTGDISFLLNSVPVEKYEVFFFNGYSLTTASFANSNTGFYKKGKAIARTEYTPVFSGKKNIAVLEYMNGHIRYWLNGQVILETWDTNPLEMDPNLWIGVRSYDTLMVIDKLTISKGKPL